ncbi:hypothetical protein EC12741_1412 [Escherichia coli 1.2741]|nr:hypothetical protein EC12741_1412 [Escherichia coli 1.2741]KDA57381.1 hypothetical protein AA98_2621 [Escherichia coli 2-011-08_S1_C1]
MFQPSDMVVYSRNSKALCQCYSREHEEEINVPDDERR